MESFGTRLRQFRDARGWSQERLGFELNVSKATISKWETGRAQPSLRHLSELRELFASDGLTLDYLINGIVQNNESGATSAGTEGRGETARTSKTEESYLLKRFRALSRSRRRGLLDFISE